MYILAAAFIDAINVRKVPGPSTRIDLRGVQFSAPAPEPLPTTFFPHLVVLLHAPQDEPTSGVLEVVFKRDGEQIARNVSPVMIEPGLFSYQLVQAEIEVDQPHTFEAHVRVGPDGDVLVVPFSVLDYVEDDSSESNLTPQATSDQSSATSKESFDKPDNSQ